MTLPGKGGRRETGELIARGHQETSEVIEMFYF